MDTTIAQNLIKQLGRQTFVMLGASAPLATERGVMFSFKGCRRGNKLVIELADDDTYTVALWKINARKAESDKVAEMDQVYAENLLRVIESMTGLRTRLL